MSGFGMTICGGSYPASQSEHLIAHYMDMLGTDLPQALHGEHIAVTTLSVARLQDHILGLPSLRIRRNGDSQAAFRQSFGAALGDACWTLYQSKHLDDALVNRLQKTVDERWPEIRARLKRVGRSAGEMEAALTAAGAPISAAMVGIPAPFTEKPFSTPARNFANGLECSISRRRRASSTRMWCGKWRQLPQRPMRPIAEFTVEARRAVRAVLTDIDDTLTENGRLPAKHTRRSSA